MVRRSVSVQSIVLGLFILLLLGCGFTGTDDTQENIRERIDQQRELWQDQNVEDYTLVYRQRRGTVVLDSVKVFVRAGVVDSVAVFTAEDDVGDDEPLIGTVESFFTLIENRVGEEVSQFSANFDEQRGFPTEYGATFDSERRREDVRTIRLEESTGSTEVVAPIE